METKERLALANANADTDPDVKGVVFIDEVLDTDPATLKVFEAITTRLMETSVEDFRADRK